MLESANKLDNCPDHLGYSLRSLKGGYIGDCLGSSIGLIKRDTCSLDYRSFASPSMVWFEGHRGFSLKK